MEARHGTESDGREELLRDHHRFRELVSEEVRHRMKHDPVITEDDWVMRGYFSVEEFHSTFPDPYTRDEWLTQRQLQQQDLMKLMQSLRKRTIDWSKNIA